MFAHSGAEARAAFGIDGTPWGNSNGPYSHWYDFDKHGNMNFRFGWGGEVQGGAPYGGDTMLTYSYANNKRTNFGYDAAGNVTSDGYANTYNASNQQTLAESGSYILAQTYDGDGLRAIKYDNGPTTLYLRSTVLGGAVVTEIDANRNLARGYVYAGSDLLAVQSSGQVTWVHADPFTKSQRVTDISGSVINTVELDPWGANTNRSSASPFQPQNFTTYIRDGNGQQDAMARRYSVGGRFSQPDPYSGSYNFADPQSLNRYAYTKNDPVNRRDPSGLDATSPLTLIRRIAQPVVNAPAPFVVPTSYDHGADISGFFGSGSEGMMLELTGGEAVPQNTFATNNPGTIDNRGSGQDCNISVSFTGDSINSMKNGENYYHGNPGLGFTVSISGLGAGGIARLGENKVDPRGRWVLQQLMNVYAWNARQGDTGAPTPGYQPTFSDKVDPRSIIRNDNRSGGWIDHPGPNMKNGAGKLLTGSYSKWNFLIKAHNGKKECSVGFHAEMTFNNGVFHANWGPGLY